MSLFGNPDEKGYEALVAENSFISDIQVCIEDALETRGLSQCEFAALLGVSEPRVSQMLGGNGRNLQARTVARIAHVLCMKPHIEFVECDVEDVSLPEYSLSDAVFTPNDLARFITVARDNRWGLTAANDHDAILNEEDKLEVA